MKIEKSTYIGNIAIQSIAYVHLTHGNEEPPSTLDVAKVSPTELEIINLGQFDWLIAD